MNLGNTEQDAMHDEEPKTLSLLSGVAASSAPPTEAELLEAAGGTKSKLMGRGAAVVGAIALVAAGSLYAMRLTHGNLEVSSAKEAESTIENFVAKRSQRDKLASSHPLRDENIDALFEDADAVVAMFAADVTDRQVPLEYVKKNPFQLVETKPAAGAATPVDNSDYARQQRLRALTAELGKYKLYSVMTGGQRNVAVVNGEFVQERQKLGSFTVTRIEPLAVTLSADGAAFQLTIDTDPNKRR